jgi:hypothetical protein
MDSTPAGFGSFAIEEALLGATIWTGSLDCQLRFLPADIGKHSCTLFASCRSRSSTESKASHARCGGKPVIFHVLIPLDISRATDTCRHFA